MSDSNKEQAHTIPPRKLARLIEFLGALPPASAIRLYEVVELDRVNGGGDLPHEEMLNALRRKLFENELEFPRRPISAIRLFYQPFEDFFIAQRRTKKRRARIARPSLAPIWRFIQSDPNMSETAAVAQKLSQPLRDGVKNGQITDAAKPLIAEIQAELYSVAAKELAVIAHRAEEDEGFRDRLVESLGDVGVFYDLLELGLLLPATAQLQEVRAAFKKPVSALSEDDLFTIRHIYAGAARQAPAAASYVLCCLLGRMEAPWKALAVYYHLRESVQPDLPDLSHDANALAETLFEDMESMARGLEREAAGELEPGPSALRFQYFADFADGMEYEAKRRHDSVFLNRIAAGREVAAEALERFTEQSLLSLREALPLRQAGGSSRLASQRPDIICELTPALAREGQAAANFLADAVIMAGRVSKSENVSTLLDESVEFARRYASDLVTEIRAAEGDDRQAARRLMDHTLQLIAPLVPSDDIGLFRDQASAAALSA